MGGTCVHRRNRLLTTVCAVSLVFAAACGDDDDSGGDADVGADTTEATSEPAPATTAAPETTSASDGTTATTDGTSEPSSPGGGSGEPGLGEITPYEPIPAERHITDEGEPVHGGDLVFGIGADTANAWAPFKASTATPGYIMIVSVSDPLFTATPDGEIAPMLVESWEHNEDYTEWTYHIREGVRFHDGTPLDGAAVEFNLETCQYAPLTAAALLPIKDISSAGQTVTIQTHEPYVVLPRLTTERQCAYMFSPEWLKTLPDVPQRTEGLPIYDAELAATPAAGNSAEPVGLGAFVFESYQPGNGNSFKLVRNEDYWRGPNGVTGEELPYLDSIEGVVSVEIGATENSLRSGQFDITHSGNSDATARFLEDDEFEVTASSKFGDTSYIMLNVAEGPEVDPNGSNADSPLLNVHCRRALAHATDVDRLIEERGAGLARRATGPFGPGVLGYLEDSGYPAYDPDLANEEFDTCLSELGTDRIEFSFNTTNDPFNVESNTLIIAMWNEVLGDRITSTITPIESGQYIGLALTGNFHAFGWANHGGIDPATQAYWWQSQSSAPVGELALNFGRFRDPAIDEALVTLRTNADPAARKDAAETITRQFGENVYNLWTSWVVWAIISHPYVNGVESNVLPDTGEPGIGLAFSGRHMTNQLWCDEGVCD
jgi:peptide/nickel transport system substrate-binding protein